MAACRFAGSGGTYQTPVPADAVAPDVPQQPLSTSTTLAPLAVADNAAQVPAGAPPITRTSPSREKLADAILTDCLLRLFDIQPLHIKAAPHPSRDCAAKVRQ